MTAQNRDLSRQLALCQASTRAAHGAAHAAETASRALREELARAKTLLGQVRSQCANDVRKRDVQIARLKTHLVAQQRGSRTGPVGPSITITPGNIGRARGGGGGRSSEDSSSVPSLEDAEYSLKQETTEFLTQLSQSLSEENDALIGLVRGTLGTLREVQGISVAQQRQASGLARQSVGVGHNGAGAQMVEGDGLVHAPAISYEALARDLNGVLSNLRDLLSNPSFAPIEEVQVREEEIQRLREGWEKMESRWREAVVMMQGWRKRMLSGGDTVNLDELKMGLGLGKGLEVVGGVEPAAVEEVYGVEAEIEASLLEASDEEPVGSEVEEFHGQCSMMDEAAGTDLCDDRAKCKKDDASTSTALREVAGNNDYSPPATRKVSFTEPMDDGRENNTPAHLTDEEHSMDELANTTMNLSIAKLSSKKDTSPRFNRSRKGSTIRARSDRVSLSFTCSLDDKSCLTITQTHPTSSLASAAPAHYSSSLPPAPELTIEQKLKHAETEARLVSFTASSPLDMRTSRRALRHRAEASASVSSPGKKSGIVGRPQRARGRRRKSTLSPDELAALMGIGEDHL